MQRYKREAQRFEELSTGTTTEARAYLRSLLSDLSGYFALQKDSSPGLVCGNSSGGSVIAGIDGSFANHESSDASFSLNEGDTSSFRSQQGVLAIEAKIKEYEKRLHTYQELASLSVEEYLAINRYSQYDYENMNAAIRSNGNRDIKKWGPQIRLAVNGMKKLPVYEGLVYRGARDGSWANIYQVGSVVTEKGFASSSWVPKWSEGSQLQFKIQSKTGRDITSCSAMQSEAAQEKEVLFPPNTKFEVTDRIENGTAVFIQMREV